MHSYKNMYDIYKLFNNKNSHLFPSMKFNKESYYNTVAERKSFEERTKKVTHTRYG